MKRSTPQAPVLEYGPVSVLRETTIETVTGETAQRQPSIGKATVYEVYGPGGLHLTLHDTRWLNGDRDVRVVRRNRSPERYDTIVGRLRMGVSGLANGDLIVWLRVADPDEIRPTRKQVSLVALQDMTNIDPKMHLVKLGATRVGTASELGISQRAGRNQLGARFPPTAELVPVAAFMLTTILPRMSGPGKVLRRD